MIEKLEANRHSIIAYGGTAEILSYGENEVLKLFRSGFSSQSVEEEFTISMAVFRSGFYCPEPIRMIDAEGRKGIVYRRIRGDTMLRKLIRKPWQVRKLTEKMALIHKDIHSRQIELRKQKDVLAWQIDQATLLTADEKERVRSMLEQLPEDSKLCHGDFHPDNIVLGDGDWVIDWMTGMSGNPAGDVARTIVLLEYGTLPEETSALVVKTIDFFRRRLLKRYLKAYMTYTDMRMPDIEPWIIPVAAARLCDLIIDTEKQVLVRMIRERIAKE